MKTTKILCEHIANVGGQRFWGATPSTHRRSRNSRARVRKESAYNAWVDRLNAIRLLQALVAAGAKLRAPMANDWVHSIAVRDVSLEGTALASVIAYAEGEGWLADSPRTGWVSLTRAGEVIARVK